MRERAPTADEKIISLATQRAIDEAGGLVKAAGEVGLSTTQLSRLQSTEKADLINVRHLLTLDALAKPAFAGVPPLLNAIARLLGCVVLPGPGVVVDQNGIPATAMQLTMEMGDVVRAIHDGLADDDLLNERETRDVLVQLDEMDGKSAKLRRQLIANLDRLQIERDA